MCHHFFLSMRANLLHVIGLLKTQYTVITVDNISSVRACSCLISLCRRFANFYMQVTPEVTYHSGFAVHIRFVSVRFSV